MPWWICPTLATALGDTDAGDSRHAGTLIYRGNYNSAATVLTGDRNMRASP
jgi:hypothetical protein